MEKISGILPSSSRVAAVDLKESSPVRPGTPTFGRTEGVSSLREAKLGQTASRAVKISQDQLDWRSKDMKNAATVRELSDRFFSGNTKAAGNLADARVEGVLESEMNRTPLAAARASTPAGFDIEALDRTTGSAAFAGATSPSLDSIDDAAQPDGLHPRGSFVDVRA